MTYFWFFLLLLTLCSPNDPGGEDRRDDGIEIQIDTLASGLVIPWDIDFAPDGRIFVTERSGRIRQIVEGKLLSEPWAELEVANWQAAGLSGLALSKTFEVDGYLYVMGTFRAGNTYFNRIYRFRDQDGQGIDATILVDSLPSVSTHAGGALDFGPDGLLYVGMGDNENIALVQKTDNTIGKILRYQADGSIPADNPFPRSPVYAIGLRNPQGFAWHPIQDQMFATEHGPSGFVAEGYREHQDELNAIRSGENYGWPIVSGRHQDARFAQPLVEWTPAIAPSGLTTVQSKTSPWFGSLLIGALRGKHLRRLEVESSNGTFVLKSEELLLNGQYGRIRCVEEGPDGMIYVTTSNVDTPGEPKRGLAGAEGDLILRLKIKKVP